MLEETSQEQDMSPLFQPAAAGPRAGGPLGVLGGRMVPGSWGVGFQVRGIPGHGVPCLGVLGCGFSRLQGSRDVGFPGGTGYHMVWGAPGAGGPSHSLARGREGGSR